MKEIRLSLTPIVHMWYLLTEMLFPSSSALVSPHATIHTSPPLVNSHLYIPPLLLGHIHMLDNTSHTLSTKLQWRHLHRLLGAGSSEQHCPGSHVDDHILSTSSHSTLVCHHHSLPSTGTPSLSVFLVTCLRTCCHPRRNLTSS